MLTLLRRGRVNDTGAVWARQPLPLQACQPRAARYAAPKQDPDPKPGRSHRHSPNAARAAVITVARTVAYYSRTTYLQDGFETGFVFRIDTSGGVCGVHGMHGVSGDAADASRCGRRSRLGSNGFGFVAQSSADAADALGCAGSGMGLWGDGDGLDCVSPALAVRVDTHFCCVLLSTCC